MMKKIEFNIGEKVPGTYWTVLEKAPSKNNASYYKCKCVCGKIFNTTQRNLTAGFCISCGCANRENAKKNINKYLGLVENTNLSTINSNKPGKANTSGVKGVSYRKTTNNYVAYIGFKGKLNIIGYFKTLEEAAAARKQAE